MFQLQLQHNEVIALMNLLNRLSESVKFVHEMGSVVEKTVGRRIPALGTPPSQWQKICEFITGHK